MKIKVYFICVNYFKIYICLLNKCVNCILFVKSKFGWVFFNLLVFVLLIFIIYLGNWGIRINSRKM